MERPKGDGREDPVRGQACPSATPRNAPRWMNQEGKGGSLLVSAFRAIEARTGEDFCLGVMMLCGLLAIVAMVPFGAYLAWMGSYQLVALDLALIMVTGAAITYAWRRGSSAVAALVLVAANSVWSLCLASLVGTAAMFWACNVVVLNFLLVRSGIAVLASALLVFGMLFIPVPELGTLQRISFCVACSLVAFNAFIFATRSNRQAHRLRELAARDPLTGVGNRRLFNSDLDYAVEQARIWKLRPALAVLDLDHFKRINDRYGHEAGDQTLIAFTNLLRTGLRQSDRLYRIGGEEFVLLVPDCHEQGLAVLLDQIQGLVRKQLRCHGVPVTVSIGAALLEPAETGKQWLARADRALYVAKRLGRDCTVVAEDSDPVSPALAPAGMHRAAARGHADRNGSVARRRSYRESVPLP